MLILEAANIKKYFGDRLVLDIESLKIYVEDRIGIVGANGAGKTTLLNILAGSLEPDYGTVRLLGEYSYIKQLDAVEEYISTEALDGCLAKELGVVRETGSFMSGGERTRLKIAMGLSKASTIMFADEPTSNLDIKAVAALEEKLSLYKGALLVVSHDRMLLDKLCNKIIEIDNSTIKEYSGNYSDYRQQKEAERQREEFEYNEYIAAKGKLESAIADKKYKVGSMRKTPTRMGNSEARLHKMGNQKAQANLNRAVKAMESRLDKLEVKERPKEMSKAIIDIQDSDGIHSKIALSAKGINKSFGTRVLLDNAEFVIPKGSRTALIGDNGTGKTTLLEMILQGCEGIRLAPGVKPGYFRQNLDSVSEELSILENVMRDSIYPESFVRNILARLLFRKDEIYKKVGVLSGGERVRVCFAKIFTGDINLLILDEPTNYLDIYSMEAVETALKEYNGTILFVSHDRSFLTALAQRVLLIENNKISSFEGSYQELCSRPKADSAAAVKELEEEKIIIENRISEVVSRLSVPTKKDDVQLLDAEYKSLLQQLKELKSRLPGKTK